MKIKSYVWLGAGVLVSLILGWYIWTNRVTQLSPALPTNPSPSPMTQASPSPHPLLTLDTPLPEARITSPLVITGQARGNWFFEATFPVVLTDWDGLIIAEGYATAQGDWMTQDFVPFDATLTFEKPSYGDRGTLILQKANPSDLPENDDAYEVTVWFE